VSNGYTIGSIVKFRGREWVIVPPGDPDILQLRPIAGSEDDSCGIYLPAEMNRPEPAVFPLPSTDDIGDFEAARLLHDAARLLLRHGAGPFRSMGHLAFRPRPYQFVPLLMALRLNPVRMLIADDVGIGKTIEAALIAREMLDRGLAKRLAVICPPYLCDKWQQELYNKFSIDATIIRSESFSRLERNCPRQDISIFKYFTYIVVSVDFVKADRYRYHFIEDSPDLVIVDEAHGCAKPPQRSVSQQQRHQLIHDLAQDSSKHLLLVTATPHSGVEESFMSLLGLLKTQFASLNLDSIDASERAELARHILQRQRGHIKQWLGVETKFPEREPLEAPYRLTPEYKRLFDDVYKFARDIIFAEDKEKASRRRVHYWTALALLRCVMSSPGAAMAALQGRLETASEGEQAEELNISPLIFDSTDTEFISDIVPSHAVAEGEARLAENDRRRLRDFARRAEVLKGGGDAKIARAAEEVGKLLKQGYKPIVFCRFIATADYVAEELKKRQIADFKNLHVISVTGEVSDEERSIRVAELCKSPQRVLVATDCLSEGIDLQEGFNAVIHYDLPWNPNRLEQREGRVDRFGQASPSVKTVLIYGEDNPIDGAVLRVLIRKAREIHKRLGIMVPLPVDSESVMQAVMKALFLGDEGQQLRMFELEPVIELNKLWDKAEERERGRRTVFSQPSIDPGEVAEELNAIDAILGDPRTVERFIKASCQRLGVPLTEGKGYYQIDRSRLPDPVKSRLPEHMTDKITFEQPVAEGVTFISRTHLLTATLAEHLLDNALNSNGDRNMSSRCGIIKSTSVDAVTSLFLLRLRYLVEDQSTGLVSMAEECVLNGFKGLGSTASSISRETALSTWEQAAPSVNISESDKKHWGSEALGSIEYCKPAIINLVQERAKVLHDSYERVRKTVKSGKVTIKPNPDVDVLSLAVVVPQR
jgi:superfamily II DNA or RNA helicase